MTSRHAGLSERDRERLSRGEHEEVASELLEGKQPHLAAPILEDIWDFDRATTAYLSAGLGTRAVQAAIVSEDPQLLDRVVTALLKTGDDATARACADILTRAGRHAEAARLLPEDGAVADTLAAAQARAGDPLAASQTLLRGGKPHQALKVLLEAPLQTAPYHAALASVHWALGDAHASALAAQRARRAGDHSDETRRLLARCLVALGHELAASLLVPDDEQEAAPPLPGRYRIRSPIPATIAGSAYEAVDRATMQEVEVHLLLADFSGDASDPETRRALRRFSAEARRGAALGHPAIRPILALDERSGMLVMPRFEGRSARSLIRPGGMPAARARALVGFLAEGLVAGRTAGLCHGALLPSLLELDAAGRPCLGPFGTAHLRGLMATRTGTLEEILFITAPELKGSDAATTPMADAFALGALWAAFLSGEFELGALLGEHPAVAHDAPLIRALTAPDPTRRADLPDVLSHVRRRAIDLADVQDTQSASASGSHRMVRSSVASVTVLAADTWSDAALDGLCAGSDPWLQPIVDREGRRIELAPWPAHCRRAPDNTPGWRDLVPASAGARLPSEARRAVHERLRATSLVATEGGIFMLALDDLLSR